MSDDPADGFVLAYAQGATWTYVGGRWSNVTSSVGVGPHGLAGPVEMTFDVGDGYVLAFSPPACSTCNGTWEFRGGHWSSVPTSGPTPLYAGPMTYDYADHYVVMYPIVNETWTYHAGVWSMLTLAGGGSKPIPGPNETGQGQSALVYDPADGYVLLFGGTTVYISSIGNTNGFSNETWDFRGGVWTHISLSPTRWTPPIMSEAMLAYDTTSSEVVLFGGFFSFEGRGGYFDQAYSYRGGVWSGIVSSPTPPAASVGGWTGSPGPLGFCNDSADQVLLLFTTRPVPSSYGDTVYPETWVWGTYPPLAIPIIQAHPVAPYRGIDNTTFSPNTNVSFSAPVLGGTPPYTFSWDFGNGIRANVPLPTTSFPQQGPFQVSLWINDSRGHSANSSLDILVYAPLATPQLRVTSARVYLDQPTSFEAIATNGTPPYTYAWSFGDGGNGGNVSKITHVFTSTGPFVVGLTVSDAQGDVRGTSLHVNVTLGPSKPGPFGLPWLVVYLVVTAAALVIAVVVALLALHRRKGDTRQTGARENKGAQPPAKEDPAPPSGDSDEKTPSATSERETP